MKKTSLSLTSPCAAADSTPSLPHVTEEARDIEEREGGRGRRASVTEGWQEGECKGAAASQCSLPRKRSNEQTNFLPQARANWTQVCNLVWQDEEG